MYSLVLILKDKFVFYAKEGLLGDVKNDLHHILAKELT